MNPESGLRSNENVEALAGDMLRVLDLFDQAPGGMIVTVGRTHVIRMLNRAYSEWIGGREVVGKTIAEAFPNLVTLGFYSLLDKVYETGLTRVIRGSRTIVQQPDGSEREAWVNFVLQPLREPDGQVCGIFCQGHEVTNEKLAADAVRQSRIELKAALEESQAIVENSHDLITTTNDLGIILQVNRRIETLLGYRREQVVGRSFTEFLHPDDLAETRSRARNASCGMSSGAFTNRFRHRDGGYVPIMWSAAWSPDRRLCYSVGRDMREAQAAEEKLRQAQKMEAIGRLTGGVAHDFNNLLTAVIGSAEALSDALADRPDLREIAKVSLDAANRGAALVRQLLAFSRNQPLTPESVDCNGFLTALAPILQRTIGPNVEIELETADEPVHCLADLNQLTSAVLNLCINARDAMAEGGRMTLRVGGCEREAVISVADTGEGMSPEVRQRALEPFFTTKPAGKGSGLGLSMVYGFVTQSGGRMDIESPPGCGATVTLYLPRTEPAAAGAPAAETPRPDRLSARVLLVEDDDLVRGEVSRQLRLLGCAVTDCAHPQDAIGVLYSSAPFDLLMTDIDMPGGMNGRQLADHARLLRPELPVLFTSGYNLDPIVRGPGIAAVGAFLQKPYRRAQLAAKLQELLQPTA